jgi:transposase
VGLEPTTYGLKVRTAEPTTSRHGLLVIAWLARRRPRSFRDDLHGRSFRQAQLRRMHLLVRPDTVLRWHRDLIGGGHAARPRPKRTGRPPTVRSIRLLVLRLVRENPSWAYRRVHGELLMLGVKVAPSTVWEILKEAGIDPAPERSATTWAGFLRSQAEALLACDFLETVTLTGARMYVLAVIEHHTRRTRVLGATAHPTAAWVTHAARNLVMDLQDAGCRAGFLIRDRDGKFPDLFDAVLTDAGRAHSARHVGWRGERDSRQLRRRFWRRCLEAGRCCGAFLRAGCCRGLRPRELLGVRPRTMPISSSMRSVVTASSQARPIWD